MNNQQPKPIVQPTPMIIPKQQAPQGTQGPQGTIKINPVPNNLNIQSIHHIQTNQTIQPKPQPIPQSTQQTYQLTTQPMKITNPPNQPNNQFTPQINQSSPTKSVQTNLITQNQQQQQGPQVLKINPVTQTQGSQQLKNPQLNQQVVPKVGPQYPPHIPTIPPIRQEVNYEFLINPSYEKKKQLVIDFDKAIVDDKFDLAFHLLKLIIENDIRVALPKTDDKQ